MNDQNRLRLVHGPYVAPRVQRGDIVTCLYRDGDCVVVNYSDSLIAWPRCRLRDNRGGVGLWVGEDLARAIRLESEIAIAHWWGVEIHTVRRWRRALGVGQVNPGTARLYRDYAPEKCARLDVQAAAQTPEIRRRVGEELSRQRRGQIGHPNSVAALLQATGRSAWTPQEDAILTQSASLEVAVSALPHRSRYAVRLRRWKLRRKTIVD